MLSPRWRKVIGDLWGNRLRTVLVVLSVAVGVFAVGMIDTVYVAFTTDLNRQYAATLPAHAVISTDTIGNDAIRMASHVPGVVDAEGRRTVGVQVLDGKGNWRDLELNALANYNDVHISRVYPQTGTWPPGKLEVLLERSSLTFLNIKVGDTLTVKLAADRTKNLQVVGSTHDMSEPAAFMANRAMAFVTLETMEWLGYDRGYNNLLLRVTPSDARSVQSIRDVATLVANKLKGGGHRVGWTRVPEPGKHPVDDILRPLILLIGVLGFMALVLSGFLVINTITAIMAQQIRQIGIMKSVGATRSQIMGIYFSMVFVFCIIALAVAIPAGAAGGQAVSRFMAAMVNFDARTSGIPWQVLLLQIAVGFLVPYCSAVWPISRGARITAREALSSTGISEGGYGGNVIDRLLERVRMLSRPALLTLRNTFRRKGRLTLTLITLTLAGAIFVAVLSVQASLYKTINDAMKYWNFDVQANFTRAYRIDQLVEAALSVPGTSHAESWGYYSARRVRPDGVEGDSITVIGLPLPTDMLRPFLLQGRWLLPADENAIVINTDVLKKEPDVRVGDHITLTINSRELEWQVVGLVRGVLTGRTAYANYPYIAQATRGVGRASSVLVKGLQHNWEAQDSLAHSINVALREQGYQVRDVRSVSEDSRVMQSQLNILVVFLLIMAVLLAVVGGLGLMGTMSINVLERTREIGVMRAVGASNTAVATVFLGEGVFIGWLSWCFGAVLGWPVSVLLSNMVGSTIIRAPLSYTYSWLGVWLWLLLVTFLAALASLVPSVKAARMTVRDVLAYE